MFDPQRRGCRPRPPGAAPPPLPLRLGGSPLPLARQKGRAIGGKRGLSDHGERLAAGKVDGWVTRNGARKRGVRVIHAGTPKGRRGRESPLFRYSAHGSKTPLGVEKPPQEPRRAHDFPKESVVSPLIAESGRMAQWHISHF